MTTGEKIIKKAEEYKGRSGGFVWDYWSGLPRGQSWCVGFVLYVLYKCKLKSEIYNPSKTSLPFWLPTIEEWLHSHATHVKMADAQPGDIVIFTWTGGGNNARKKGKCSRDHIGFIRKKGTSEKCYTIEGNTSGGIVAERTREKTYIFAIYRLNCCKAGNESTPVKKPAKSALTASGKAIDISAWQGKVSKAEFKKVLAAGYDKVILRASYTALKSFSLYEDKVFAHNIKTAHAAGLKIGVYHYSQATSVSEAKKEAEFVLKIIKPFKAMITEPVVFDWEWGNRLNANKARNLGKKKCTRIVEEFCEAVKKAGYEPMIYASYSVLVGYLDNEKLKKQYKVWVAHYAKSTPYEGWYMWQYSSDGSVPGLSGRIDVNKYKTSKTQTETVQKTTNGLSLPTGTVKEGDSGTDVKRLQKILNWACEGAILRPLTVDGEAGSKTIKMLKLFQDAYRLSIDGVAGNKTIDKMAKVTVTPQTKAIMWAVSIARDNSFAYGTGSRAHHNGCYFCGTNITGPKKAKKGDRWEKTYCCNPFIHATYAHGAGIPSMIKACKKANAAGMETKDWIKHGFDVLGKCAEVKFDDLKKGDVIICKSPNHVWMYTGEDWLIEASGEGWGSGTIAHKTGAKAKFRTYQKAKTAYVVRLKG